MSDENDELGLSLALTHSSSSHFNNLMQQHNNSPDTTNLNLQRLFTSTDRINTTSFRRGFDVNQVSASAAGDYDDENGVSSPNSSTVILLISSEEERVVLELQAQYGNKWAKMATHLNGRTDNDVKNFWSSRQKRLARILQTSTAANTSSKSLRNRRGMPVYHDEVSTLEESEYKENPKKFFFKEIENINCLSEAESSSRPASCSSPCIRNSDELQITPVPDLLDSKLLGFEANPIEQELGPPEKNIWIDSQPLFPFLDDQQPQTDLEFSSDTRELLKLDFDMFTTMDAELGKQLDIVPPFLDAVESCGNVEGEKIDDQMMPDCIFDDLPADMFDQIEPLPNGTNPSQD